MNYPLRSKPKNKINKKVIFVIILFILLVLLGLLFPSILRTTSYKVASPMWSASQYIATPFLTIKNFFVSKNSIITRNQALEDEIASLRLKELDYDALTRSNEELRAQLGRSTSNTRIISSVLSKPPRSPYDTLVIDVGSNDGVVLGSRVYLSDNIIIGVIKNVTPKTSLVELFTTGNVKQDAVLTRTGASFVLTGRGGANLELVVPKDTDVLWGDVFSYPGLNSSIIATVHYIDTNSQSSFKTLYLRTPGNVFAAKRVFVDKP